MKRRQRNRGFTIIELVIVIAVIAILASVLIPTFGAVIGSAQETSAKYAAKNAYTTYFVEHKGATTDLMVYKHSSGLVVTVENGVPTDVYDSEEEFFAAHDEIAVFVMYENTLHPITGSTGNGGAGDSGDSGNTGDGGSGDSGSGDSGDDSGNTEVTPTPIEVTVQDGPLYMWSIDEAGNIASVSGSCLTEKEFTDNKLEEEIVLEIDKPWQISWTGSHNAAQYTLLLSSEAGMGEKGTTYIFFGQEELYGMTIGRYDPESGNIVNYGFKQSELSAYANGTHTYTICNEFDGTKYHIVLYIDVEYIDVMRCVQGGQSGSEVNFDLRFGAYGANGGFATPTNALCDNLLINTASGDSEVTHTMLEHDGALHCTVCPCVIEERTVQDGPIYKWNFNESGAIEAVFGPCLTANDIKDTIIENRYYKLDKDITLKANTPWEISWTGEHVIPGYYTVPLCSRDGMTVDGTTYIFLGGTGGEGLYVGKYVNGQPVNYGFSRQYLLNEYGFGEGTHTYIIRSEYTGSKYQVNLYIDGTLIGAMQSGGRDIDFDLVFGATGASNTFYTPKNFNDFTIKVGGTNSITHTVISGTSYAHCIDCGSVNIGSGAVTSTLNGKYISVIGDSISTFDGVSNNTAVRADLSNNTSIHYYGNDGVALNDTYWMQAINYFGMELCVNNAIAGGKVTDAGLARAEKLHTDAGQNPDIILFYMGINDAGNNVSVDKFGEAYKAAIEKMQNKYSGVEIICLTLLPHNYSTYIGNNGGIENTKSIVAQYNAKIKAIATEMGATVIDIAAESGITWENCGTYMKADGIHPNKAGMDLIANAIIAALEGIYVE